MSKVNYIFLCALLLGCNPGIGFETSGLPCSVPSEISDNIDYSRKENINGCWRVIAGHGHGYLLKEPGLVSCDPGEKCVVVLPDEKLWVTGAGENESTSEDVDCSEKCY